jgi:NAD+ kinase
MSMPRVLLISNTSKPAVVDALARFRPWLADRAQIIAEPGYEGEQPIEAPETDLVIVLGGDGTLLAQARRTVDLGAPIVGVNFGKLGFLAEFSLDELKDDWPRIAAGSCPLSERVMIQATVYDSADADQPAFRSLAMNDCMIAAGHPFRMIRMALAINPQRYTTTTLFGGDGVIIATPTGSTAYNASAGGPIVAPDVDALIIRPICPQSLAFRSIVTAGNDQIEVKLVAANEGTTLVIDGQRSHPLIAGNLLRVSSYARRVRIVRNHAMGYWKRLAKNMHWAVGPKNE